MLNKYIRPPDTQPTMNYTSDIGGLNESYLHQMISSTDGYVEAEDINCDLRVTDCAITVQLWAIMAPIVLVLGTVGNVLIILVMGKKSLRNTAFGHYLISISVCDTIAIWVALTRHFIKNAFRVDIRRESVYICWLQKFLLYGSIDASVWLLCAVTFERTLSIYCPTRSVQFKSLRKTRIFILVIIIIQYGWNLHVFWSSGLEYKEDGNGSMVVDDVCGSPTPAAEYFKKNILNYIAMVDYSIVPFLLMLTMNIAIFIRLRIRDKLYNDCATLTTTTKNNKKPRHSNVSHKTLMLLPVTICFLVTTLPSLVFTGIEKSQTNETDEERARMEIGDFVVSILMYLNHSLNFFLYCLTGKMFRARCLQLFQCCRSKEGDNSWETIFNRSPLPKTKNYALRSMEQSPNATPYRSRSNSQISNSSPTMITKTDRSESSDTRNSLYPPPSTVR